ncbi:hypothetical protein V5F40_06785 [Xanthobacter sp. DSM 14520]|uniref:hypothetical protein n=1 Tax=Xanthobacter autotrophicus (strain ATCC BAA-1158 / Py2) TaxID=78245 RepID=UPI00372B5A49
MTPEEQRLHDVAAQIALAEMLRLLLAEVLFDPNAETFRKRLQAFENSAVSSILGRDLGSGMNEYTERLLKELATGWITRLMTSIRHPADSTGNNLA